MKNMDENYRNYYNTSPYPDADWAMGERAARTAPPAPGRKDGPSKPSLLERAAGFFRIWH